MRNTTVEEDPEEHRMAESNEREALAAATEEAGWQRWVDDRVDVYRRGASRVRVIWQGGDVISGGSRFLDNNMETYSRDLATVKGWLFR